MPSKLSHITSTLLLLCLFLLSESPFSYAWDQSPPECPYPCLPPPTSVTNCPPPPPSAPTEPGSYSPPPPATPGYGYPPPTPYPYGPFLPPPFVNFPAPPPPNPILPYFPWYYLSPPPQSSAPSLVKAKTLEVELGVVLSLGMCSLFLM